jgi:agmatine/peptidylarginine deiminase
VTTLLLLLGLMLAGPEFRVPADHERNSALLIGASQMMFHHEPVLLDVARALQDEAPVYGLVANDAQREHLRQLLTEHDLPADAVRPVVVPVQSMWLRDFGPLFVKGRGGGVAIVDTRYPVTEHNPDDDGVPSALAEQWNVPSIEVPLWLDGGHVLSNGQGLMLVSNAVVNQNVVRDDIEPIEVQRRLREALPFDRAEIVLPLNGEPTGHLDVFLAFVAPDRLVVARMDPQRAPAHAERLDRIAARLEGTETRNGPLNVLRIDTPAPREGVWRTYTNVAIVGDAVLVPTYPDIADHFDRDALEAYRRWFPDRTVVGIDARSLVERRGALHCVSVPLPPAVHRALVREAGSEPASENESDWNESD